MEEEVETRCLIEIVSVVIPCRNECAYITAFVQSILKQDYPKEFVEIIVADGMSDDGTRKILESFRGKGIKVIDNPDQHVSQGLNLAIRKAVGSVIMRMDVHCIYPSNYITCLVDHLLSREEVGNVGARCETLPADSSLVSLAISLVTSSAIGVGNSVFRVDNDNDLKRVDTVPFGCWERKLFNNIGYFDVDLVRNQDDEFNQRILKAGLEIHLIPNMSVKYFGRKTISAHAKMFYQYGLYKPLVNTKIGRITTIRQLAPPMLIVYFIGSLSLIGSWPFITGGLILLVIASYFGLALLEIRKNKSIRRRGLYKYWVFIAMVTHISYGVGYWKGLFMKPNTSSVTLSR